MPTATERRQAGGPSVVRSPRGKIEDRVHTTPSKEDFFFGGKAPSSWSISNHHSIPSARPAKSQRAAYLVDGTRRRRLSYFAQVGTDRDVPSSQKPAMEPMDAAVVDGEPPVKEEEVAQPVEVAQPAEVAQLNPELESTAAAGAEASVPSSADVPTAASEESLAPKADADAIKTEDVPATDQAAPPLPSWDHSNRKVVVYNVYKFVDRRRATKEVDRWIQQIKDVAIKVDKIKKPPKEPWMAITLTEATMVQPLMDFINNTPDIVNKKGVKLVAKRADPNATSMLGRDGKRSADDRGDTSNKRQRINEAMAKSRRPITEEEIKDAIIPLWRLEYKVQARRKMKEMIKKCAIKIVSEIKARFRLLSRQSNRDGEHLYAWLKGKQPISMNNLVKAPDMIRNKCEFNFGYRYIFEKDLKATDEAVVEKVEEYPRVPAVGFMATGWSGGVVRPHCCENIPRQACRLVEIVDDFLEKCPLPPYDPKLHKGTWRTLTVRTSQRTKECMVIVMHAPARVEEKEIFQEQRDRLVSMLKDANLQTSDEDLEPVKVTSIFLQEFGGLSNPTPDHPVQHAYGKEFLLEQLGKCTFQISPGAFFQVNTAGAEELYNLVVEKVREVSPDPSNTLLFDVCCGTGTIGLTCMKEGAVGSVVGVDISEPAIQNARKNAILNGFESEGSNESHTTRFVASRAEHVMSKEIGKARASGKKFVAVVDPARDGLHADVVCALRSNESIDRLVYVSCNPTATLVRDAALLCAPSTKRFPGTAFRVTNSTPVDMFPSTNHCEMVMTFDRLVDADIVETLPESKEEKSQPSD